MKYTVLPTIIAALLVLSACNSSKEAQKAPESTAVAAPNISQQVDRESRRAQFEERRKQQMAALVEQLNLTEEQKAKFDDINKFYRNKLQEIRNNNQGDRQSMREAIMQIREEQDIELEALLTPEQYQTFKKFQEEQRQNRRSRSGRRGRGGNRG